METLGKVLAGILGVLVIGGIFAATQIADSHGRTLADRVPVLGPVVRFVDSSTPGGGQPMISAAPTGEDAYHLLQTTNCTENRYGSPAFRDQVAKALIEVSTRANGHAPNATPPQVSAALDSSCATLPADTTVLAVLTAPPSSP